MIFFFFSKYFYFFFTSLLLMYWVICPFFLRKETIRLGLLQTVGEQLVAVQDRHSQSQRCKWAPVRDRMPVERSGMGDTEAEPSWQGMAASWLALSWDRLRIIQSHGNTFGKGRWMGFDKLCIKGKRAGRRIRNEMKEICQLCVFV